MTEILDGGHVIVVSRVSSRRSQMYHTAHAIYLCALGDMAGAEEWPDVLADRGGGPVSL